MPSMCGVSNTGTVYYTFVAATKYYNLRQSNRKKSPAFLSEDGRLLKVEYSRLL